MEAELGLAEKYSVAVEGVPVEVGLEMASTSLSIWAVAEPSWPLEDGGRDRGLPGVCIRVTSPRVEGGGTGLVGMLSRLFLDSSVA
jgi:hypothetical protein